MEATVAKIDPVGGSDHFTHAAVDVGSREVSS
jgi:hypothetical protein